MNSETPRCNLDRLSFASQFIEFLAPNFDSGVHWGDLGDFASEFGHCFLNLGEGKGVGGCEYCGGFWIQCVRCRTDHEFCLVLLIHA